VIVWAASSHISRDRAAMHDTTAPGMISLGELTHDSLGASMYSIGFTTLRGTAGFARPGTTKKEWDIGASAPGSLESLFDAAGFEYAFLDLRHIAAGGEWLNYPIPARPLGYVVMDGTWPKIFDGLIYTREMTPSTPLTSGH
jgi:erythromycin esterase-like protein